MSIEPRVAAYLESLPSAAGKRVVVTGANSGIGLATVRLLAARGAKVVMASRDLAKAEAAKLDVLADQPEADLWVERLDLASLASIKRFADRVADRGPIDAVIANAGVMALPWSVTEDGLETQFGVNHLGHFALVGLLLPALRQRPGARVVVVSSTAAYAARIDFGNLMGEVDYGRWRAYGQSKLANLLFARALARRLAEAESGVSAYAAQPGMVYTNLQRNVVRSSPGAAWGEGKARAHRVSALERFLLQGMFPLVGQTAQMGALPQVFATLSPRARSGELWGPRWLRVRGGPVVERGPAIASDAALQDRLWQVSEELTSVHYPGRHLRGVDRSPNQPAAQLT